MKSSIVPAALSVSLPTFEFVVSKFQHPVISTCLLSSFACAGSFKLDQGMIQREPTGGGGTRERPRGSACAGEDEGEHGEGGDDGDGGESPATVLDFHLISEVF